MAKKNSKASSAGGFTVLYLAALTLKDKIQYYCYE